MPMFRVLRSQLTMLYMLDQDCVGFMSPQKLFFYHLPTRGRAGVKLGDADTLQTYL
jgi:hypothetical protein